jgi:NAD+ kinase
MTARSKRSIKHVGIVVRPDSAEVAGRARRLAGWLEKRGVGVLAHAVWAGNGSTRRVLGRQEMMREVDLVVVLGGDGSLLGAARLSVSPPVPVVGINHGSFGFLTESDKGDLYATMERILDGDYHVDHRSILSAAVKRDGKVIARSRALNDAVVTRGSVPRMLTLEAAVDGKYLATYQGDGLIIATPTGSTAYSLSAGGPIVDPSVSAIVVTPISSHTLASRPLVLDASARVSVKADPKSDDAILSLDGQENFTLQGGDVVEVARSRYKAAIVCLSEDGFYGALRRKISWGSRGGSNSPS